MVDTIQGDSSTPLTKIHCYTILSLASFKKSLHFRVGCTPPTEKGLSRVSDLRWATIFFFSLVVASYSIAQCYFFVNLLLQQLIKQTIWDAIFVFFLYTIPLLENLTVPFTLTWTCDLIRLLNWGHVICFVSGKRPNVLRCWHHIGYLYSIIPKLKFSCGCRTRNIEALFTCLSNRQ